MKVFSFCLCYTISPLEMAIKEGPFCMYILGKINSLDWLVFETIFFLIREKNNFGSMEKWGRSNIMGLTYQCLITVSGSKLCRTLFMDRQFLRSGAVFYNLFIWGCCSSPLRFCEWEMGCEIYWVCQDYPIKLSALFQCNSLKSHSLSPGTQGWPSLGILGGSVGARKGVRWCGASQWHHIHRDSLPYQNKVDATIIPFLNKLKTPTKLAATKREPFSCCLFLFCIR